MGRTTPQHEHLIDHLDDMLIFEYLYASELLTNPDLARLQAMGAEVYQEASLPANAGIFPTAHARTLAVHGVMNLLQRACSDAMPPADEVGTAWLGLQNAMSLDVLRSAHATLAGYLASLFTTLIARVDSAFSEETKPFVTKQQVSATLRAWLKNEPANCVGPIQVDLLGALAHQEYLAALNDRRSALVGPERAYEMVLRYFTLAEDSFIRMKEALFSRAMVSRLHSRGRKLHLTIDRAYPWAALWRPARGGLKCLDLYVQMNLSGAIHDGKFAKASIPGVADVGSEFVVDAIRKGGRIPEQIQGTQGRIFFTSDDVTLHINEEPVQKHAVMAIRYDSPLRDVERRVQQFRNYLVEQRRQYCANAGEPMNREEAALLKLRQTEMLKEAKPVRTLLNDKSSILGHLCALIDLEMQRDPVRSGQLKKTRMKDIEEIISNAGFRFRSDSVRKSCARSAAEIRDLRVRYTDG